MASQRVKDRCLQAVQGLAREEGWQLPPEGIAALVEAILPFVQHASRADDRMIRKIALNYYHDGPMVQQMLAKGSPDGERLWEEWRNYFVRRARWACSKGVAPEDVEDLAQEVYTQAHRALPTFRFESRLQAFFANVFNNRYKQWVRDTKRIQEREQPLIQGEAANGEPLEPAIPDESRLPEDVVIQQMQDAELRGLVDQEVHKILNSVDRQILVWYCVDHTYIDEETGETKKWTDEAIGARLGMPRNTVTARRRRALQRLKNSPRLEEIFRERFGLDTEAPDP